MKEEEFNELFGKTTFIEHLTEIQQTELFNVVKGLIKEQTVKEVIMCIPPCFIRTEILKVLGLK